APACRPKKEFWKPVVFAKPASPPKNELLSPALLACPAPLPKKALKSPFTLPKPALLPKKALLWPVLTAPAPTPAKMLFAPALLRTREPPMLYCAVVLIAPRAVSAGPVPVLATERVKSGLTPVSARGTAILAELTEPSTSFVVPTTLSASSDVPTAPAMILSAVTASLESLSVVTALFEILSGVTALLARYVVVIAPDVTPSGLDEVPSPLIVESV